MSDRMTSARVADAPFGTLAIGEWGRRTRPEMIAKLRESAQRQKESAERVLSATDEEIIVETYLGPHSQRNLQVVSS
jgi:hypothetical protein